MADRVIIDKSKMTSLADQIRTKTETSDKLTVDQMTEEVSSIKKETNLRSFSGNNVTIQININCTDKDNDKTLVIMDADGTHTITKDSASFTVKNFLYVVSRDNDDYIGSDGDGTGGTGYLISEFSYMPGDLLIFDENTQPLSVLFESKSWQCFVKGTLITLADGTKKPCEDITYDDDLLVWDFYEGKLSHAKPMWIKIPETSPQYSEVTLEDGTVLRLIGRVRENGESYKTHHLYDANKRKFEFPQEFGDDMTFREDGKLLKIVSMKTVHEEVEYYNIITEKHYNCFINGILGSSSISNRYPISEQMIYDTSVVLKSQCFVDHFMKDLESVKLKKGE